MQTELVFHMERMVGIMYVIGTNEYDFVNIKSRTMMAGESCKVWNEVERVTYECNLTKATIFPDYELAIKIVEEIKSRKDEIKFENDNIIGQILDKEHGKEFDVDKLKVYELIPTECTERK